MRYELCDNEGVNSRISREQMAVRCWNEILARITEFGPSEIE